MARFFILFAPFYTFPFQCVDMDYHRVVNVLYFTESRNEGNHIIPVRHIPVVKSKSLKEITFSSSVCLPQKIKVLIHSTKVRGNGHLVVIKHDNHVAAEHGGVIQSLKRLASGHGAIAC